LRAFALSFLSPPRAAGAQGHTQDLASGKAVTPAMCRALPWVPAFAGMTRREAGMTRREAGMTRREAGMTGEGVKITEK